MANKVWVLTGTTPGTWSTGANWSGGSAPGAADNIRIPAGTAPISGYDATAVTFGYVVVEAGYTGTIGSASSYLIMKCARFEFSGLGAAYIDLNNSNISPNVFATAAAAAGYRGLYLKGSNLATLSIEGGSVGLAALAFETAVAAAVRIAGSKADVWIGAGVTLTDVEALAGAVEIRCAVVGTITQGGTAKVTTTEVGAVATWTVNGGQAFPQSTGTVTTMTLNGGTTDFTGNGASRTVTTLKQNPGSQLVYDPNVLTITTRAAPDYPVRLSAAAA